MKPHLKNTTSSYPSREAEKLSSSIVDTAVNLAFREGASKVFLFGSALKNIEEANDIDLGIDGIEDPQALIELGRIIEAEIKKPVDIVDLNSTSNHHFIEFITTKYHGIFFYSDGR